MADPYKPRAPFAPWDRRELPGAFDVEESARRVGNYKWVEMKLFEALGGWVATVPELDVKMRLGTHCYHHAWHAELWHKRLPELREMNPDRLTQPANDALVAFMDAMTEPEAPELAIDKLVGVYRVLIPRKVAAYTYHLNNTSQITDAPTIRSLGFILQDENRRLARRRADDPVAHRDARRGRAGRRPPDPPRAGLMVEAGGITGPGLHRVPDVGGGGVSRSSPAGSWPATIASTPSRCRSGLPTHEVRPAKWRPAVRAFVNRLTPSRKDATDAARTLMHSIFVGKVQALEGPPAPTSTSRRLAARPARRPPTPCRST